MALVTEYPWNNRADRIRHYSDAGMLIEQTETGYRYAEAIDIYPTAYHYAETDEPIEKEGEITDGDE